MIVHRILDAVFRTLDTVDAIRARVDTALGRAEAQPPSSWPAVIDDDARVDGQDVRATYAPVDVDTYAQRDDAAAPLTATANDATPSPSPTTTTATTTTTTASGETSSVVPDAVEAPKKPTKKGESTLPSPAKKSAKSTLPSPAKKPASSSSSSSSSSTTKKPAKKKVGNRKGSIDRQGRDLDSPRANVVATWIESNDAAVVAEDAALDGKRTLARVLWAVAMAEHAGVVEGLTAADTSALLSSAADVEVFATNVARAFRDEHALFVETSPDGRSKRYVLTDAGRGRLGEVATR